MGVGGPVINQAGGSNILSLNNINWVFTSENGGASSTDEAHVQWDMEGESLMVGNGQQNVSADGSGKLQKPSNRVFTNVVVTASSKKVSLNFSEINAVSS